MNEKKIKEAFEQIQAESELKSRTKDFIAQKTKGYTRARTVNYRAFAAGFGCMLFLLLGGHWLYFTPTVEISIDINPSVELGVNRFDKIVSLESYNEDGKKLLDSLDLKFMDYSEAVNEIIENDRIVSLLSRDEIMTIAVIGADSAQSEEIFSMIQSCGAGRKNMYCYSAGSEEVELAHQSGLSYGKYKAFLELQALDPEITIEQVQQMTMRQIRDQIASLSGEDEGQAFTPGNGHQGEGNGHGRRNRRGR